MSKPTHTLLLKLDGTLVIKPTAEVQFIPGIKGSSEYKCNQLKEGIENA